MKTKRNNVAEMESNEILMCQHHQGVRAVATCQVCGNVLCKECFELDNAIDGWKKDDGKVGALGCCVCRESERILSLEVGVARMKKRAKRRLIVAIVALVIGAFLGLVTGVGVGSSEGDKSIALITGAICCPLVAYFFVGLSYVFGDLMRCVWDWIKGFVTAVLSLRVYSLFSFFVALGVAAIVPVFRMYAIIFKSFIIPVPETLAMLKYLKEVDDELKVCKKAANSYIDYVKYVDAVVCEKTQDINNTYAQMVAEQGTDYAEKTMANVKKVVLVNCKELTDKIRDRRYGKASFISKIK